MFSVFYLDHLKIKKSTSIHPAKEEKKISEDKNKKLVLTEMLKKSLKRHTPKKKKKIIK